VRCPYEPVLDDGTIPIMAYSLETIPAEKFETIVRRSEANGCARDFYGLDLLLRLHGDAIWAPYARTNSSAQDVSFDEVVDSVLDIGKRART